jgi:hypothetical protein
MGTPIKHCFFSHGQEPVLDDFGVTPFQWEFQEPKLEVPTRLSKPYVRPMNLREYTHKYGLIWYITSILGSWNSH